MHCLGQDALVPLGEAGRPALRVGVVAFALSRAGCPSSFRGGRASRPARWSRHFCTVQGILP